ncbi:MAG: hypothetical protein R2941_11215 [Desulfobacterales bacterium]
MKRNTPEGVQTGKAGCYFANGQRIAKKDRAEQNCLFSMPIIWARPMP